MDRPGVHQRSTYVTLVFGLHQAWRTGVLEVRSGRAWRRLYFVSGNAVWYASDKVEEELGRTLVKEGLVSEGKMKSLLAARTPFEPLSERLLESGLVGADVLRAHRLQQLGPAVSAPLGWEGGEWSFDARDSLSLDSIDPSLFPDCHVLRELWLGVPNFVQMQEALAAVGGEAGRRLVPRTGLSDAIELIGLTGPLLELPEALGRGATVEELFQAIPDKSGHMMQLLWFLWNCDLLGEPDVASDEVKVLLAKGADHSKVAKAQQELRSSKKAHVTGRVPVQSAGKKASKSKSKPVQPKPQKEALPLEKPSEASSQASAMSSADAKKVEHLSRLIRTAHEHRMGKDFYAFFDLSTNATSDDVRSAYERLTRGWTEASEDPNLSEEDYGRVKELLYAAKLVWQTLTDANRRKEYEHRLAAGTAPRLDSQLEMLMATERARGDKAELSKRSKAAKKDAPGGPAHTAARDLMKRGNYKAALDDLREARTSHGSNAAVLADLGWCTWKVYRGQIPAGEQEGAEDLLLLAQTFDPSHGKTMEYLCRMAKDKGDTVRTILWLQRLLKAHPRSRWALEMQATLRSEGLMPDQKSSGGD